MKSRNEQIVEKTVLISLVFSVVAFCSLVFVGSVAGIIWLIRWIM